MNLSHSISRRSLLRFGSLALLSGPLLRAAGQSAPKEATPPDLSTRTPLQLGVATFSLTKQKNPEVIKILNSLRITRASLYHSHAPWVDGTPEACKAVVDEYAQSGITVTGTGVIDFTTDEKAARKAFETVKFAGVNKICARPQIEALPLLDKLVKEYDIQLAIHNHGPTDLYPTSADVWSHVQPFDKRIGICVDVGHAWRAGGDPAEQIKLVKDRLYEVHLKDTKGPKGTGTRDPGPVVVGTGAMNIRQIVAALLEIGYQRETEFEYEVKSDEKIPGLSESVGFVRGLETALTQS